MEQQLQRFVIHLLNHTYLVIDISAVGLPSTVLPRDGEPHSVSSLRFQNWKNAADFLKGRGVRDSLLDSAVTSLRKTSLAIVTGTERR